MSSLNLNNIYVGENGRVQLSGGSSNIDFVDTVDQMIAARRIPADNLETRIEANDEKVAALKELQTLVGTLKDSMANLYGATSFDNSKNIFESKQIFAASDGSDAGSLMGVTASNAAETGSYTFEITQVASRHKLSSETQPVAASADVTGITGTGSFTITGGAGSSSVTVAAGDTLQDIRDKINNVKDSTGVQASVVKVSDTESTLILTSTEEGEDNRMSFTDDGGATVLQNLGILNDPTTIEPARVIDDGNNAIIELDGITVTRGSNEFSDLIDGLTINLYDAEPGTEITIEIEQDLNQAKTAILDFVDAYNAVQTFINEKTFVDPTTGEASDDAILLGNTSVKGIESALQQIAGSFANGVTDRVDQDDYSVLAEIGLGFVAYGSSEDPLLSKTIEVDETALNEALLNEPDEVMELFLFRGKSDNSDVTMTGFDSNTNAATYEFTIDASGGIINSVTYDITVDGVTTTGKNAVVSGNSIRTADGLRLFYGGDAAASDTATVTTSVGIGAQFYFELESILDDEEGTLTQAISELETQTTSHEEKVDRIDERLARQREVLMDQFIAMESALARMKNIQSSLDELMSAGKDS
ncbi:flagellar hook protein FliD [Thalassospira sp. HJ]|uniref:flagellar filament capping protein FliD n=1 Tax=Thalassospira sp. HJ TaxID=1616823 RepID=UPI0005CE400A|nr:flagellar filament capping protein FliD [Thalassospira sp. HJ]KJE36305.1 flagellar hook protein FliD [Thalassospira sp. HJ]